MRFLAYFHPLYSQEYTFVALCLQSSIFFEQALKKLVVRFLQKNYTAELILIPQDETAEKKKTDEPTPDDEVTEGTATKEEDAKEEGAAKEDEEVAIGPFRRNLHIFGHSANTRFVCPERAN